MTTEQEKKTGNSIFSFEQEAGIDSKLGNWLLPAGNKELSIKYIDCKTSEKRAETFELTFEITAKNLLSTMANVRISTLFPFFSPVIINRNGQTKIKVPVPQKSVLQYMKSSKFTATVRCDRLTADSEKFEINTSLPLDTKPESTCLCKKTSWTEEDLKYIVTELRKRDNVIKQAQYENKNPIYVDSNGKLYYNMNSKDAKKNGYKKYMIETSFYDRDDDVDKKPLKDRIFFYDSNGFNIKTNEANYNYFTNNLNRILKQYKIDSCIRKIHFFAQAYVETDRFRTTYEKIPKGNYSGGDFYRGRGLLHLTHDYNYLEYYCFVHKSELFNIYINNRKGYESVTAFNTRTNNKYISVEDMKKVNELVTKISTDMYYACDAAGWYWWKNKIYEYADEDDIIGVSAKVNNPSSSSNSSAEGIGSFKERKEYYELLKIVFNYEECQ
jgi:predicted chitinase